MNAAYEGLSDEIKDRIEGLIADHDFVRAFGHRSAVPTTQPMREQYPVVEHPVVIHPPRLRPPAALRQPGLHRLASSGSTRPRATNCWSRCAARPTPSSTRCRFHWQPDSIAFWDNRAVQHYASSDYWPDVA